MRERGRRRIFLVLVFVCVFFEQYIYFQTKLFVGLYWWELRHTFLFRHCKLELCLKIYLTEGIMHAECLHLILSIFFIVYLVDSVCPSFVSSYNEKCIGKIDIFIL